MREALVAAGIICTTVVVPVLAVVLIVWFVLTLVRGTLWPWRFWAAGVGVTLFLHVLGRSLIHLADKD